jgi:hypothetical protein
MRGKTLHSLALQINTRWQTFHGPKGILGVCSSHGRVRQNWDLLLPGKHAIHEEYCPLRELLIRVQFIEPIDIRKCKF